MTSKLTRERIELIANFHRAMTLPPSHDEIEELARMALAAMDSEPVAWLLSGGGTKNVVCFDSGNAYADPLREVTPLYRHAQQPPVVGDGRAEFETWMLKRWGRERRDDDFAMGKFIYGEDYADSYTRCVWKAWSASRAAMLNAQPQNAPQNIPEIIPDGWIPVSEHLPKEKGVYQVWNGKYVDNVPFWFGSFQSLHSELITHWMPLPAAPQEVNHG